MSCQAVGDWAYLTPGPAMFRSGRVSVSADGGGGGGVRVMGLLMCLDDGGARFLGVHNSLIGGLGEY
jgi:hypothetical protein